MFISSPGLFVIWRRPSVGALFIRTVAVMPQAEGRRRVSFFGLAIPARDKHQKPRPSALETRRSFFFLASASVGAPSFKSEAAVRERTLPRLTPA